jgi:trk system potassium uptake protein
VRIVIIGAGFTGIQLAKRLVNGKNDVVLVDNDEETVRHASNRLDCTVIQADGNNLATLEEIGISRADALVCVTSSDEVNMITCSLVDSVYPELLKIARVRNYAYYSNTTSAREKHPGSFVGTHRPLYGIDYMIHPDVEAAQAIVNAVDRGAVTDVLSFNNSDYELTRVTVEKGSVLAGQSLQNIRSLSEKPVIVAYVESKGKTSLPDGTTIINADDCIGILSDKKDSGDFLALCGAKINELRKIALVGAGRIGTIVAEKIMFRKTPFFKRVFASANKRVQDFVIIDTADALAKAASEKFPAARVFRADATDESFIREEGIDSFDLVICATHNHELNMVLAAYLESLGVRRSVSLVETAAFADIARKIGIDVAVPLRDAVIDSIMSHLRGRSVIGIHTVNDGALEIIECHLLEKSFVDGKMIKDIAENGKFLILLVQKRGDSAYRIPTGNTVLTAGDSVVLIMITDDSQYILDKFNGRN